MERKILTLKGVVTLKNEEPSKPVLQPRTSLEEANNWLCTQFPEAFNLEFPKPLKIGIHKDIRASYLALSPSISKRKVQQAMTAYTSSLKYTEAVLKENQRYNLEGEIARDIEEKHKEWAKKKILKLKNSSPESKPLK